ncbi:MAG: VWD domain-containing protein, partial [Acidimicrobiia bacterium]
MRIRTQKTRWAHMALLCALAALASACTGPANGESATTASPAPALPAAALMDQVFGGTQAVQDFAIHIDMAKQTDDVPVSFYHEVLDRAAVGQGDPVDLAGGFTFTPTTSIEGQEVDGDGDVLPSLSVDFGLLGASPEVLAAAKNDLVDAFRNRGNDEVADLLAEAEPADVQMLVEIVTADLAERRTHVGPGDRSAVDITFTSVSPGDGITSVYLFGETLPGDPTEESGLSDTELFVYRWNHGLISILGGDEGLDVVMDETAIAVKGSTILSRETKRAVLADASLEGFLRGIRLAEDSLSSGKVFVNEDGWAVWDDGANQMRVGTPAELVLEGAVFAAEVYCQWAAAKLNAWNKWQGTHPQVESDASTAPAGDDEGDTLGETTTTVRPPGPVSCHPPSQTKFEPPFLGAPAPAAVYGDVHVLTFDGATYANQAAGEFALFDNGGATVQLRTEPYEDSDVVSVATAVAAQMDGHAVSVHASGETYVDDERTELTRGVPFSVGSGAVLRSQTGWVLAWPNGTAVTVNAYDGHLSVFVAQPAGPSTGMLGDGDGDPDNDLVARSGAMLDPNATSFETFYPEYIDTWRITDDESLFHYGPGQSTNTFAIDGFPAEESSVEALPHQTRDEAEAACRDLAISREDLLLDCILDVGLTGDRSFAYPVFEVEASAPERDVDPTDGGSSSAEAGPDTLTVGDLTFAFGPNPPIQDPSGFQPQWTCSTAGGAFYATSRFVESPGREIKVTIEYRDAEASGTGEQRFAMVVELNAEPYAWMVTFVDPAPGSIDELSVD